jgi:hypothetical protein
VVPPRRQRYPAGWVRPVPVLQWASVRLRPLTEAECYARCYGGRHDERVTLVSVLPAAEPRPVVTGERLKQLFDGRPEPRGPVQDLEAA